MKTRIPVHTSSLLNIWELKRMEEVSDKYQNGGMREWNKQKTFETISSNPPS